MRHQVAACGLALLCLAAPVRAAVSVIGALDQVSVAFTGNASGYLVDLPLNQPPLVGFENAVRAGLRTQLEAFVLSVHASKAFRL